MVVAYWVDSDVACDYWILQIMSYDSISVSVAAKCLKKKKTDKCEINVINVAVKLLVILTLMTT